MIVFYIKFILWFTHRHTCILQLGHKSTQFLSDILPLFNPRKTPHPQKGSFPLHKRPRLPKHAPSPLSPLKKGSTPFQKGPLPLQKEPSLPCPERTSQLSKKDNPHSRMNPVSKRHPLRSPKRTKGPPLPRPHVTLTPTPT